MILVKKAEEEMLDELEKFLQSVDSIKEIERNILKNAVYIKEENDILGVISFERFNDYGLIRYFVFKKNIDIDSIYKMFEIFENTASLENLKFFFSIVNEEKIIDLFKNFGFDDVDKNYFFIEEKNVLQTKYKDSKILMKKINKISNLN